MADESRMHNVPLAGPSTHALVIGVGDYPFLDGGTTPSGFDQIPGLEQLSSPPISARALATWLIESFDNPDRPLGSVRLLVGEKKKSDFKNPRTKAAKAVPSATIDNIETAVDEWRAAAAANPENLGLFYFCGHGLGSPPLLSLLAADFAAKPKNALEGAIDFSRFRAGMKSELPRLQCYFIDACRTDSDFLGKAQGIAGKWFVTPSALGPKNTLQPTYYATLEGNDAHGEQGKTSYFTQALIDSLGGAGAEKDAGRWKVSTTRLNEALTARMARRTDQQPSPDNLNRFFLHLHPGIPDVQVVVVCEPEAELEKHQLRVRDGAIILKDRKKPDKAPWEIVLPAGRSYSFEAEKPGLKCAADEYVQPPELRVPIKVGP